MSLPDMGKPGAWRELVPHALALMASLEEQIHQWWTFGSGTADAADRTLPTQGH